MQLIPLVSVQSSIVKNSLTIENKFRELCILYFTLSVTDNRPLWVSMNRLLFKQVKKDVVLYCMSQWKNVIMLLNLIWVVSVGKPGRSEKIVKLQENGGKTRWDNFY